MASAPCGLRRFNDECNTQLSDRLGGESAKVTASALPGGLCVGLSATVLHVYQSPDLFLSHLCFLESLGKVDLLT